RPAMRIVSLVPSATQTLAALGARDRVVGVTDFDTGPEAAGIRSVGGGLDPSLETIAALKPDVVVGWESAGGSPLRQRLQAIGIPFFSVEANDTADIFRVLGKLGALAGRGAAADSIARSIRAELEAVRASVAGRPRPTVFYVAGDEPPITPGARTFVSELIGLAGGRNVFADAEQLWPQVSMEEIVRLQPDLVVVPVEANGAERVAALRRRPGWRELRAVRGDGVRMLPVELVNRPGPDIARAARALRDLIHPEAAPR
ncbi:MAG TPA: cobalamin-binding protein, partial [Longimicrobium sp.]|nr:cobalamin-binding protein [Longimicrobium sp.]